MGTIVHRLQTISDAFAMLNTEAFRNTWYFTINYQIDILTNSL